MDEFYQRYQLGDTLGEGGFGRVFRCYEKSSGLVYAAKTVEPQKIRNAEDREKVENEISICNLLDHGHIVRLYASFSEMEKYMMVFELLEGGELFDIISSRDTYSELDASYCVGQLLLALSYLESKRIIHRDVKPENLMLVNPPRNGSLSGSVLKLVDFGIAKKLPDGQTRISCDTGGTPYYLAPETLKEELLGFPVDMWATGVILYILLVGSLPFWLGEKGKGEMFWRIVKGEFSMDKSDWETISDEAKQLVTDMLKINQNDRITADKALQCQWINNNRRLSDVSRRATLCRLKAFNAKRKLRSTIFAVIAHRRMKSQTPPRRKRVPRHESGLGNSADELGSESEGSVVDDGEVLEEPVQTVASRPPSTLRKLSDVPSVPSPLLVSEGSRLVRSSSDSGESGVAESPVVDGPTDAYVRSTDNEVLLRGRRHHMPPEQKKEWRKKRRSIKEVVKELKV